MRRHLRQTVAIASFRIVDVVRVVLVPVTAG
jgi:hypothetical protein